MVGSWAIPIMFGILFFSTVFSAQDVYGPHYTTFDGLRYDFFPNGQAFFETSILLSEGLANTKKNANFEICVRLDTAEDTRTTIPIEIVQLNLVSCQPITVTKETDLNFLRVLVTLPTPPVSTPTNIVDILGSYEIFNPAGKSMVGEIVFEEKDVVLGIPACLPPSCPSGCNNGTCVADDVCVCESGFHGETCTVPDCTSNEDCDDNNSCTLDACNDNGQCVSAPIPSCSTPPQCTSDDQCTSTTQCEVGYCDSIGKCQTTPIEDGFCTTNLQGACAPGTLICVTSSVFCTPIVSPSTEVCADGIDNDCDGLTDCEDSDCINPEVCDGLDNDCDGTVDNNPTDAGGACSAGVGQCSNAGIEVCSSEVLSCDAVAGTPQTEVCDDGIDNDCDGLTDCDDNDDCPADLGAICSLLFCGDGIVDSSAGEQCDDGNTADGDFCSSTCLEGECVIAPNSCSEGEICLSGSTPGSPTFCQPEGTSPPP